MAEPGRIPAAPAETFHNKSKDSGNKLKDYILNFSSVATGVFFFTLTGKDLSILSNLEKGLLVAAMSFFALTVTVCLLELNVDSRRFFQIAKQKEKPTAEQNWEKVRKLKRLRLRLMNTSYISATVGFIITFVYMITRLT